MGGRRFIVRDLLTRPSGRKTASARFNGVRRVGRRIATGRREFARLMECITAPERMARKSAENMPRRWIARTSAGWRKVGRIKWGAS